MDMEQQDLSQSYNRIPFPQAKKTLDFFDLAKLHSIILLSQQLAYLSPTPSTAGIRHTLSPVYA